MYPRKIKQNQLSKINNDKNSITNYYSDKDLDSKKKLIVVKVLEDLKKRNKRLVDRFDLTDKFLKQGLNSLIKTESLLGFDYSKFLAKAEQEFIIDSIIKSNSANKNLSNSNINTNINQTNSHNNYNSENYLRHNYENQNECGQKNTKSGAKALSPRNTIVNGKNYNHSNDKYDELKLVKEKDEWGILAKKNYMEYLEDKISKLQKKEVKKKEITEILANQILEKNKQRQIRISNEEKFFDSLTKDVENWRKSEAKEKEHYEYKIKEFNEKRDNVFQSNFKDFNKFSLNNYFKKN